MNNWLQHQVYGAIRTTVTLGLVTGLNDEGAAQTVDVETHDDVTRAAVEVHQPFGFSSSPPADGMISLLLPIGNDPSNLVALLANPSARFAGLGEGETVMYASDGSRHIIRQGGAHEIWGVTMLMKVKSMVINAPEGTTWNGNLTVNGDLIVNGNLTATGDVSDGHGSLDRLRGHYNAHIHGSSPPPTPTDPE